jgi:hypothetical protein
MASAPGNWPGWHHDHPTAEYWSARLAQELVHALPRARAERLARDYAATGPGPREGRSDADLTALAAAWLATQDVRLARPIAGILTLLRVDAALIGAAGARAVLAGGTSANMGTWQPGRTGAARGLLEGYDPRGAIDPGAADPQDPETRQIAQTRMERLARTLALATLAGHDPRQAGQGLLDALTGALGAITLTAIVAYASQAAMALFAGAGKAVGQWVIDPRSKVCPLCLANADAGPRLFGQLYPSGHAYPPAHPNCACALMPAD